VSNTGTWMQRVAQDWLVLELAVGSGATALGITTGLQFLPFLLLTPFAGLVADRMPKQRLLQLTNLGMALPAAVLGLLAVTGTAEVWHVYVLAFLLGSASAFDAPARQSFVSELVDPVDLTNAVGLNSASFNAARLVGPGLAGVLIAAFGGGAVATGWVILLNAVSYAAPIWSLRHLDASEVGVYTNLIPIVGVLTGVVVLGEPLSVRAIVGGLVVMLSVWITSRSERPIAVTA